MHTTDQVGQCLLPERFHPKDFTDYDNARVQSFLKDGITLDSMLLIEPEKAVKQPQVQVASTQKKQTRIKASMETGNTTVKV